jgi:hypothetical protein
MEGLAADWSMSMLGTGARTGIQYWDEGHQVDAAYLQKKHVSVYLGALVVPSPAFFKQPHHLMVECFVGLERF